MRHCQTSGKQVKFNTQHTVYPGDRSTSIAVDAFFDSVLAAHLAQQPRRHPRERDGGKGNTLPTEFGEDY